MKININVQILIYITVSEPVKSGLKGACVSLVLFKKDCIFFFPLCTDEFLKVNGVFYL